jgi:glycosyltransferase involved in cell wall biosynthesis
MENSKELVSIVTPNFNSAQFITETIESVLNQTYKNWEWIIVDDNSSDSSLKIIESYSSKNSKITLLKNNTGTKGGSVCRNLGLEYSKGNWIVFFDADDILREFCLENRVKKMKENEGLDFGVFNIQHFYESIGDSNELFNKYFATKNEYLYNFIDNNIPWQTSCPIWKKEFLVHNKIKFNEDYFRLQDVEFHAKILLEFNPTFEVFKTEMPDSYYRIVRNTKEKFSANFVKKLMESFLFFFADFKSRLNSTNRKDKLKLESCLFDKYKKSIEILLLQAPVYSYKMLINYNKGCSNLFSNKECISNLKITIFYFFNFLNLNKVKGLGVYRLYKFLEN